LAIDRNGVIYAGTESGGVIFSDTGGESWDSVDPHYHGRNGVSTINEAYLGNVQALGFAKGGELIANGYAGGGAPSGDWNAVGQALYVLDRANGSDAVATGSPPFPAYLWNNQKSPQRIVLTDSGQNFLSMDRYPNVDFPGAGGVYISSDGKNWNPFNTGISFPQFGSGSYHYTNSEGGIVADANDVYVATADARIYHYNAGASGAPETIYVDAANNNLTPNGAVNNPYKTLIEAVAAAGDGSTVKVAKGTYVGNVDVGAKALNILGGFAGGSAASYALNLPGDFSRQSPVANPSQIAGSQSVAGGNHGAALHYSNSIGGLIDGFTITGALHGIYVEGFAPALGTLTISNNTISGNGSPESYGGGIFAAHLNLVIKNNIISNNSGANGAGLSCTSQLSGATLLIQDNIIQWNVGYSDHGGGLFVSQLATVRRNIVRGNEIGRSAGYGWGGGMILAPSSSTPPFTASRSVFSGNVWIDNYAPTNGSGLFVDEGARADFYHESVVHNRATVGNTGSGIYVGDWNYAAPNAIGSQVTFANSVIADNGSGTGTGNAFQINPNSSVALKDCILWHNGSNSISLEGGGIGAVTVTYSDIEGGYVGTGNLNVDPLFADSASSDYHLKSTAGRYDPATARFVFDTASSTCIDSGDPTSSYTLEPAPNGGRVNMGVHGNTNTASKSSGAVFVDGFE
jgi:hypothetical protein